MNYNTLYFIGITLSFLVGFTGLAISIRNARKTNFINSITATRIKYIHDLRTAVSEFCGNIYTYNSSKEMFRQPEQENKRELFEIHKKSDVLKYLIRLHLNLEDEYFDNRIIDLINELLKLTDADPSDKIEELIILMQYLLKLEWEGAKLESRIGIVSARRKKKLYNYYKEKHQNYKQEKNNQNE